MRPTAEQQSALREPLNYILSTEVNVRVLRVIWRSQSPLGKSEVARRARLNLPFVPTATSTDER